MSQNNRNFQHLIDQKRNGTSYNGEYVREIEYISFPSQHGAKTPKELLNMVTRLEKKVFPKTEALSIEKEMLKRTNKIYIALLSSTDMKTSSNSDCHNHSIVVGYLVCNICSIESRLRINKICVDKDFRRQGIGGSLMKKCIRETPNSITTVQLHVDTSRLEAIALYQSLGFNIKSKYLDYYSAGRDAFIMEYIIVAESGIGI